MVLFSLVPANFLSTISVYYIERNVAVSKHNCGYIYSFSALTIFALYVLYLYSQVLAYSGLLCLLGELILLSICNVFL